MGIRRQVDPIRTQGDGRRPLAQSLLGIAIAGALLVSAIAAYRFLVHPLIESALRLDPDVSSLLRRIDIFLIAVLAYWGFVRFFERRAASELKPRWRWLLVAGVAGSVSIGVTILALYATGFYHLESVRPTGAAGKVFGVLWTAAVLEEVAFRGILFRILEGSVGTRAAAVVSAVVFALAHMANHAAGAVTFVVVMLAGLMWAGVFVLSRNIWVTAAHHFCWNATIYAIGLPLSGEMDVQAMAPLKTAYHGPVLWTGGAFGPEDSFINILVMIGICLMLWHLARRRKLVQPPREIAVTRARLAG